MNNDTPLPKQSLAIVLSVVAVFMTALSIRLVIDVARLSVSIHKLIGFSGVLVANSLVLTFVALRAIFSKEYETTSAEKLVLLGLSLFTGISLLIV